MALKEGKDMILGNKRPNSEPIEQNFSVKVRDPIPGLLQ